MVCPKCKIMTQRVRRGNQLEHVCRYAACRCYGQVVARVPIPEPIEEALSVTASGDTSPEGGGMEKEVAETTDE